MKLEVHEVSKIRYLKVYKGCNSALSIAYIQQYQVLDHGVIGYDVPGTSSRFGLQQ